MNVQLYIIIEKGRVLKHCAYFIFALVGMAETSTIYVITTTSFTSCLPSA